MYSNALVEDLMGLISAIPQPPTLADKASIEAIRAAYDELTPTQQAMITNLQLLINAEAVITQLMLAINLVIAMIDEFPVVSAITLSDKTDIEAARTAYNALTPAQQALVTNYQELVDAEAKISQLMLDINLVIAMIDEFPVLSAITLSDEADIVVARTAYDALTPTQQALVTNYQELVDAEAKIAQLKLDISLVINMIDEFPALSAITLSDETDIVAARTAYNALTPAQQALVSNYQELVSAEAKIAALKQAVIDNAAANVVIDMIDEFPVLSAITLSDEADIVAARTAYNALTPAQQALVTNYQELVDAEAKIAALKQAVIDNAAANVVIDMIDEFPVVSAITLSDEADIVAARTAYNALTPAQQALVSNYQELVSAEAKIAALKQAVIDNAAANVVIDMIDEFPVLTAINLSDETEIVAARTAYNALTPAQQALVSNYQELVDAEAKIAALKQAVIDNAAANVVIDMIDDFPALIDITLEDKTDIEAARTAYNALTPAQQALVTNYQELVDAEAKIAELMVVIILVVDMIEDFSNLDDITLDDEAAIMASLEAFNALTPTEQALVSNYLGLIAAQSKIASLKQAVIDETAANIVVEMIDEFPVLSAITLSDEADIVAARTAYNALSSAQQALVNNYQELLDAEAKIAELKSMVSPSDLLTLLPFHLLSGAIILIGFYLKKRKKA
jgi:hypothetical protein